MDFLKSSLVTFILRSRRAMRPASVQIAWEGEEARKQRRGRQERTQKEQGREDEAGRAKKTGEEDRGREE